MVEFSPATREARVRFPANATVLLSSTNSRNCAVIEILLCCGHVGMWPWASTLLNTFTNYYCTSPMTLFNFLNHNNKSGWQGKPTVPRTHLTRTLILSHFLQSFKHWWFSGRILACHAGGPGSIPGQCKELFNIVIS